MKVKLILFFVLCSVAHSGNVYSQEYLLRNLSVIDVQNGKLVPGQDVWISGGTIAGLGPAGKLKVPSSAVVIDAAGKYLMPGMVDAHIHFFQTGGLYTRPDAIDLRFKVPYEQEKAFALNNAEDHLKRYLRLGITTVADVGGPFSNFIVRDSIAAIAGLPDVLVTGPLFSMIENDYFGKDKPIEKILTTEAADNLFNRLLPLKPDFIKIWYIAMPNMPAEQNYPVVKYIADRTKAAGLRLMVHATELATARLAVKAGANVLVHSISDTLIPPDFIKELKDKGVTLVPTLIVSNNYVKVFAGKLPPHPQDLAYANAFAYGSLTDLEHISKVRYPPMVSYLRNQGIPAQMLRQDTIQAENLKRLMAGGVKIATGTDAGNIGTMHASSYIQELGAMEAAGMSAAQLLKASTIQAAAAFDREKQIGSIEKGKQADLLLLQKNPLEKISNLSEIEWVMKSGTIYGVDSIIAESVEAIVQRQLNAYNARNLDAFVNTYANDVEIYDLGGKLLMKGSAQLREGYAGMFASLTNLHCEIKKRIVIGNKIIDHEKVRMGEQTIEAVAIYEVEKGKIQKVTFVQ